MERVGKEGRTFLEWFKAGFNHGFQRALKLEEAGKLNLIA